MNDQKFDGFSFGCGLLVGLIALLLVGQCSLEPLREDYCRLQFELALTSQDTLAILSGGGRFCMNALRADATEALPPPENPDD